MCVITRHKLEVSRIDKIMSIESVGLSDGVWIEEINNESLHEFDKQQPFYKNGFVKIMPYGKVLSSKIVEVPVKN